MKRDYNIPMSFDEAHKRLGDITVPATTSSYTAVPYADLLEQVAIGLAKGGYEAPTVKLWMHPGNAKAKTPIMPGDQMSVSIDVNRIGEERPVTGLYSPESRAIGDAVSRQLMINSSYNKTVSNTFYVAAMVLWCTNGCTEEKIVGNAQRRRHTLNVWSDLQEKIGLAVNRIEDVKTVHVRRLEAMKDVPIAVASENHDHFIMDAYRAGVIAPSQIAKVAAEFQSSSFGFENDSLFGLYNAFTHVLKEVNPLEAPERHRMLNKQTEEVLVTA